jgi:agmatinase
VLNQISARHAAHGAPPTYLTLDIDCLDPSFAPGTGTPEIGGLSTRQVMTILEELCTKLNFVGMDCVEVSPPYDQTELTSQAAAGFVWTYLCARISAASN